MPKRVQLPDGNIGEFPDSMSNEQIEGVLQKQFPKPDNTTTKPPGILDPHGKWSVGDFFRGTGAGLAAIPNALRHPIDTLSQMGEQVITGGSTPYGAPLYAPTGNKAIDEMNRKAYGGIQKENIERDTQQMREHPAHTIGSIIGPALVTEGVSRGLGAVIPKVTGPMDAAIAEKIGPRTVELAGEKVPQMVGEAAPTTPAGRLQTMLKRGGVKAPKFDEFTRKQSAKVKDVIRTVAQKTANMTGPMPEEPGAAVKSAADATFETARPMYAALDEDLITVPGDFHSASVIVKQAIARAKRLGFDFEAESQAHYGEQPMGHGKPVGNGNQPLQSFMRVRSELGKLRRGSADPAYRYAVSQEMKGMTEAMDNALSNTGLKDTWKEADRLWAKGYALNEIADAVKSSTEGVESAAQPKGNEVVPSVLKGKKLEETLKDLADDGTLARGLSPEETSNLRHSANILKRAQATPVGQGAGETAGLWKAIGKATTGSVGPTVGAGIGYALGGIGGAEKGAAMGLIIQQIGTKALVGVMTETEGVKALEALDKAKTPAELKAAQNTVIALAGQQGEKKRKVAAALTPPTSSQ